MIKCVIGLGNPGKHYAHTRHNIGRRVVEAVEKDALDVLCFLPESFMNDSGVPVARLIQKKGWTPDQLLVVSDDFELPLGQLRLRRGGSSGGHNGLKSIFESLGTQAIPRLRVGIGPAPPSEDPKEFVLQPFRAGEREAAEAAIVRASQAVRKVLESGIEAAMNEFNVKP